MKGKVSVRFGPRWTPGNELDKRMLPWLNMLPDREFSTKEAWVKFWKCSDGWAAQLLANLAASQMIKRVRRGRWIKIYGQCDEENTE